MAPATVCKAAMEVSALNVHLADMGRHVTFTVLRLVEMVLAIQRREPAQDVGMACTDSGVSTHVPAHASYPTVTLTADVQSAGQDFMAPTARYPVPDCA
ncbi:hypothetical protein BsWGS_18436 [Bradybaena similaris]